MLQARFEVAARSYARWWRRLHRRRPVRGMLAD
jgi:hypothetical protein